VMPRSVLLERYQTKTDGLNESMDIPNGGASAY